ERARKEKKIKEEEYFFIKKRKKVTGWLNGREAQILLDTGADVSVISRNTVEKIEGVEVLKGGTIDMCDVQGGKMDIVGRAVIQVELERGKVAPVGFYIVNNDRGTVIIGGMGLDALGIELKTVDYKEEERGLNKEGERDEGCEAMALRSMVVEPGEMGTVWVTGEPGETVVLNADVEQAVEGVAVNEAVVLVPIVNDTKERIQIQKYQSIGRWVMLEEGIVGEIAERSASVKEVKAGVQAGYGELWEQIKKKLGENRGARVEGELEKVLEEHTEVFAKGEEDIGRLTNWECEVEVKEGKTYSLADIVVDQGVMFILGKDHERRLYVPRKGREELIRGIHEDVLVGHPGGQKLLLMLQKEYVWGAMEREVKAVVKECEKCTLSKPQKKFIPALKPREVKEPLEVVAIDLLDLGKGSQGNRMMILMRKTQEQVNGKLREEKERMKALYDKRAANNKGFEPMEGDRVYVRKEKAGEKNPKLRIDWDGP
ncbi:hypothetical protein PFISCL1PPCAC_12215, partial [Pristionchus fissidentatus]